MKKIRLVASLSSLLAACCLLLSACSGGGGDGGGVQEHSRKAGEVCAEEASCEAGLNCQASICTLLNTNIALGGTCAADINCASGLRCAEAKCVSANTGLPIGSVCAPDGPACASGHACSGGVCKKSCASAAECFGYQKCESAVCVDDPSAPVLCADNLACGPEKECREGKCQAKACTSYEQCPPLFTCTSGACAALESGSCNRPEDCTASRGRICSNNRCVECATNNDCPEWKTCSGNACILKQGRCEYSSCEAGKTCDTNHYCIQQQGGCANCQEWEECSENRCIAKSCTKNADCPNHSYCFQGAFCYELSSNSCVVEHGNADCDEGKTCLASTCVASAPPPASVLNFTATGCKIGTEKGIRLTWNQPAACTQQVPCFYKIAREPTTTPLCKRLTKDDILGSPFFDKLSKQPGCRGNNVGYTYNLEARQGERGIGSATATGTVADTACP